MEFSRQEYWSWLPFPRPGDLPTPGIKPASPVSPALAGRFFTTVPLGKPTLEIAYFQKLKEKIHFKEKQCSEKTARTFALCTLE